MAAHQRTHLLSHVSNNGFEEVTLMVHGAINIPNIDERIPKVYVTG